MELQAEFTDRSDGFETDSQRSTVAVGVRPKRQSTAVRCKKTRFNNESEIDVSSPRAKSTPKTGPFDFMSDGDVEKEHHIRSHTEVRPGNTPTSSLQLPQRPTPLSRQDVLKMIQIVQDQFSRELEVVRLENKQLKKVTDDQEKQIVTLRKRVEQLEEKQQDVAVIKPSNQVQALIRQALDHAEKEEGLELSVAESIRSAPNQEVFHHILNYVSTQDPNIDPREVQEGFKTAVKSRREKISRAKNLKVEVHKKKMRKVARKVKKSLRRVAAIKNMVLDKDTETKYLIAMKEHSLQSSEESDEDQDGNVSFIERKSEWESNQLRAVKDLADANRVTSTNRVRARRRVGEPSTAAAPKVEAGLKWTIKFCVNNNLSDSN